MPVRCKFINKYMSLNNIEREMEAELNEIKYKYIVDIKTYKLEPGSNINSINVMMLVIYEV